MTADICIVEFCALHKVAEKAEKLETNIWADALPKVQKAIERQQIVDDEYTDAGFSVAVAVAGFNSGKYDITVMKGPLLRYLSESEGIEFAIRKDTAMKCIETESLRFLAAINYVAPGFSYGK